MDDQAQWRLGAVTLRNQCVDSRHTPADLLGIRADATRNLHRAQASLSDLLSIENREYHEIPSFPAKCHMLLQPFG